MNADLVPVIFGGITSIVYQRLKNQSLPGWQAFLYSLVALLLSGIGAGLVQAAGTGAVTIDLKTVGLSVGGGQLFYNVIKGMGVTDLIAPKK